MATLPRNSDVAEQLELLADLLELEGEASFRVLAYRRAAQRIRETPSAVAQLALDGKAKDLPGIGQTIEEKIVQMVDEGEMQALAKRRAAVPEGVVELMRLPGLGPKTVRRIWQELGVTTTDELRAAAEAGQLRALPGLGARSEQRILSALARQAAAPAEGGFLLGQGLSAIREMVEALAAHPAAERVSEAGSIRRRKEVFRDVDLIATSSDPAALIEAFAELRGSDGVVARGDTKAVVSSPAGFRVDLRVVPPECYGNLLQHFTGSKAHNVSLREDAVRRGLKVSEYGVEVVETGEVVRFEDEPALYEHLGYAYIPPELREDRGELQAARDGALPRLVELGDLRGDLHCHSTWSADGKGTIEQMAVAARERGLEYLAMTDHSHYLRDDRLERQWQEIDALNDRLAPFRVLKGIEVNIRADGSIDVDDELLVRCEWVVASLHRAFDESPTERLVAAMENPLVDCIGHPTARKINRRPPADVAMDRVIAKALATGTFLEINSQPDRLDLRDSDARAAGEAGVKVPISTDSHEVSALAHLELGVYQARRAWLTASQVLNTRPWDEVEALRPRNRG